MKTIVLRNLPPEIQLAIKRKALNENLSRDQAVVAILRDSEIERMVEHDLAIIAKSWKDNQDGAF